MKKDIKNNIYYKVLVSLILSYIFVDGYLTLVHGVKIKYRQTGMKALEYFMETKNTVGFLAAVASEVLTIAAVLTAILLWIDVKRNKSKH